MYGYVRPLKDELKIREFEQFRGVYCGLCHTLGRRYGPAARFLVNYDYTFLAMLLSGGTDGKTCAKRCPFRPWRRAACPCVTEPLQRAADYTVILAWWKCADSIADTGFVKSLPARILKLLLTRPCRRAEKSAPVYAAAVKAGIIELDKLEKEKCPSLDRPADCFAKILSAAAGEGDDAGTRVLRELLYHVGRIVYLLDAADDLPWDRRDGAYNPLIYRYRLTPDGLSEEDEAALRLTLRHSHNAISAAFQLLGDNPYEGVLNNILYLGLPAVAQSVFAGTWRASGRKKNGDVYDRSL